MGKVSTSRLPKHIRSELRASHAGEFGAVWIYRGILCANLIRQDAQIKSFALQHLATEKSHLAGFAANIQRYRGSLLLFFWGIAGFVTGALPTLLGRNWMFYTIFCVESFVDEHYREQLKLFDHECNSFVRGFSQQMAAFHADETKHRDEALHAMTKQPSKAMRCWGRLIAYGSQWAVKAARLI
ncbi:demethoxyubiquinone hydroxylase family protein [Alishewanella sp. 16-MA]|uniref:Demethoxyubiquinone hydroxylase family protein n=1 Tax=Alishewanella maricola TaxID=2795740 RepID=A0ABS8C789_9ALTE|nr:demethoxyubiquinone hydroxylase family protein [Alishewanella maricola]MCB5228211.1 demethoxyubiquinone hydroxylase family protein [Alishewanella maricola]